MTIFTYFKYFLRFRRAGFSYKSFRTLCEQTKFLDKLPRKDFSFSESIEKYFPRSNFTLESTVSPEFDSSFVRFLDNVIEEK